LKIAVVTSDDHGPTQATLAGLGLDGLVDTIIAADAGLPLKPAAHMLWTACLMTNVQPGKTIVVGDGVADLQMARAAGAGLAVGVASGVSRPEDLAPYADLILATVEELIPEPGA
jgi:phosphoglycolate phosphatase